MNRSPLTKILEWQDPPELGRTADDWPYPTKHVRSLANGELAERIRRALRVESPYADVYVQEDTVSGGYSEYTQENEYHVTVWCNGERYEFEARYSGSFPLLLVWLDKEAPVDDAEVRGRSLIHAQQMSEYGWCYECGPDGGCENAT